MKNIIPKKGEMDAKWRNQIMQIFTWQKIFNSVQRLSKMFMKQQIANDIAVIQIIKSGPFRWKLI